jgi:hypothetical protein
MTNLQTLKLNASSIGAGGPRQSRPASPVEETQELPEVVQAPKARRAATGAKTLLALLALDAIATLAAVGATGALHNGYLRIASFSLAVFAAAATVAALGVAYKARRPASVAPAVAAPARRGGFGATKAILMLLMAAGIAAYFGGAGTFAGFTAETTNPNDALASGTLTLRNNVSTNCDSSAGESNNNVNANCNVALSFTNQEPGVYVGTATVTLTNTGSLNASKLYLWAPYANGVFNGSTISPGGTVTTLSLYASGHGPAGVEGTIAGGDLVVVTSGSGTQTFKVGAAGAAPGATSIPIVNDGTYPNTAAITISAGATVADQSSDTTAANTNCYDTQQTVFTFNPVTNNPLCAATALYVQETTGGKNYCWWGNTTSSPPSGACNAPISTKPSSVSGGVVSAGSTYTVTALTGNIKAGDTLYFTEGGNQVSCTANGSNYYIGATSITLSGSACTVLSGTNTGFDNNTVITDYTTLNTLSSDAGASSVSQFDIQKKYSGKIELTPVSANGTTAATGTDLASSGARTFVVGIIIPGPTAAQNQLQGLKSTFGLTWHIDQ